MKKIYLLIVSVFLLNISAFSQWSYNYAAHGRHINGVQALDVNNLVAVGGNLFNDSIRDLFTHYNTDNYWNSNVDAIRPWYKSVCFPSNNIGYIAGFAGCIFKTRDAGLTISDTLHAPSSVAGRDFNSVYFIDTLTGYIAGGRELRDSIQTILKTTDGGQTWSIQRDNLGRWLQSIFFVDANTGFAVGDSGAVLKTIDGGGTWTTVTLSGTGALRYYRSVYFIKNSTTGFIIGGDANYQTIFKTTDNGDTWLQTLDNTGPMLNGINFTDANFGYIVGSKGLVWKSTDIGTTWNVDPIDPLVNDTFGLNSVSFFDRHFGLAAGRAGKILVYLDTTYYRNNYDSTLNAGSNGPLSLTLNGKVNPTAASTVVTFEYGTTPALGQSIAATQSPLSGNGWQSVTANLDTLISATTYYYRVKSVNSFGVGYGEIKWSTTQAALRPLVTTLGAATYVPNTEQVSGQVSTNYSNANVKFEYGSTIGLGDSVIPTNNIVLIGQSNYITANIGGLSTGSKYYYRISARNNIGISNGAIDSFIVTNPIPVDTALAPSFLTSTSVQLNGIVKANGTDAIVSFEYGIGNALNNTIAAVHDTVPAINTNHVFAQLTGLAPSTLYSFRVKATNTAGTSYSPTFTFTTYVPGVIDSTLVPSNVTLNSATLNGKVNAQSDNATVSFDYGKTRALGTTVSGTPSTITGSSWENVSAEITGLDSNTLYYYRVVATGVSTTAQGDIQQLYTGRPEIPNWDFEYWDSISTEIPNGWNAIGGVQKTPYNGGYAVKLFAGTGIGAGAMVLGGYVGEGFYGGLPYAGRPDSIAGYFNYDIAAGDTAIIVVIFKKNATALLMQINPITGSSANNFIRKSFAINYPNATVPDTILILLLNTNLLGNSGGNGDPKGNPNSVMTVANLSFIGNAPVLPFGNFVDWSNKSVVIPTSWTADGPSYYGMNDLIKKTTDNYHGQYAVRLNNNITINAKGSVQNIFALHVRHTTLNGYLKFQPDLNDTMVVRIEMFKNGQQIGSANNYYTSAITSYQSFTVNINYLDSTSVPDTARISVSLGNSNQNLRGNSIGFVDDLSFDGLVYAVTGIPTVDADVEGIKLYPNPTTGMLTLEYQNPTTSNVLYRIFDLNGKAIYMESEAAAATGLVKKQMDLNGYAPGFYILNVTTGRQTFSRKIIIRN